MRCPLVFPGYGVSAVEQKSLKGKNALMASAVAKAAEAAAEAAASERPLLLELSAKSSPILALKRLDSGAHFQATHARPHLPMTMRQAAAHTFVIWQVIEVLGEPVARGGMRTGGVPPDKARKLEARWGHVTTTRGVSSWTTRPAVTAGSKPPARHGGKSAGRKSVSSTRCAAAAAHLSLCDCSCARAACPRDVTFVSHAPSSYGRSSESSRDSGSDPNARMAVAEYKDGGPLINKLLGRCVVASETAIARMRRHHRIMNMRSAKHRPISDQELTIALCDSDNDVEKAVERLRQMRQVHAPNRPGGLIPP